MSYEVVQYPNTHPDFSGTEVTVHWRKDPGWVQLEVKRHVWRPPAPGETGTTAEWDRKKEREISGWESPAPAPPHNGVPLGAIKVYNGEFAVKAGERRKESEDGQTSEMEGIWQIMPVPDYYMIDDQLKGNIGINHVVTDEYVQGWPIIWGPDGFVVEQQIYTDVLERGQINAMVRTLRRARDGAYGADA